MNDASNTPASDESDRGPNNTKRSRLTEALLLLLARRGMTGIDLARATDLSKQSVIKQLNGHAHPRQGTLSKLMRTLCSTPGEEQMLISAYEGTEQMDGGRTAEDGRRTTDDGAQQARA